MIAFEAPLVKESHRATLRKMVAKLQDKLANSYQGDFVLFRVLRAHVLPLTNCAFNKARRSACDQQSAGR